jgi:hypothetical protein
MQHSCTVETAVLCVKIPLSMAKVLRSLVTTSCGQPQRHPGPPRPRAGPAAEAGGSAVTGKSRKPCKHCGWQGQSHWTPRLLSGLALVWSEELVRGRSGRPLNCDLLMAAEPRRQSVARGGTANAYCYAAWLRTVIATGVAPLARGTARATSPTPASPLRRRTAHGHSCQPWVQPVHLPWAGGAKKTWGQASMHQNPPPE